MSDVVLDIGGRQRVLRMDLNSLALWESLSGRRPLSPSAWKNATVADLRTLLWCCAVQVDPGVSQYTIGEEITEEVLPEVMALLERWGIIHPTATESESPAVPAEPVSDGPADSQPGPASQDEETIRMLAAMRAKPRV